MRKHIKIKAMQRTYSTRKSSALSAGFTLIELLVVISIIALLLSILMPALTKAKDAARAIVCQSNLKQSGVAFMMYAVENKESFGESWIYPEQPERPGYQGLFWPNEIGPYCQKAKKVFICPAAAKGNPAAIARARHYGTIPASLGGGVGKTKEAWVWPWKWSWSNTMNAGDIASFGRNGWTANPPKGLAAVNGTCDTKNNWRGPNVSGANRIPLLFDAAWNEIWVFDTQPPQQYEDIFGWGMDLFCINRHGKGQIDGVFVDGSARKVGLKELWTLKWHRNFNTSGMYTRAGGMLDNEWPEWMRGFKEY
jgi:prepilin-type N-terminal cleavage/methylation domain-containing protein